MSHLTAARLMGACNVAWGTRWAAPLAAALSAEVGKTVAPTQVHQWMGGARPVPEWVADCIARVLYKRSYELRRQASDTEKVAERLERELFIAKRQAAMPAPLPAAEPKSEPDVEPELDDDGPATRM